MLKTVTRERARKLIATEACFAIVASRYNSEYVDSMLNGATGELKRAGASNISIFRVPGAYEIPIVAARLASLSGRAASDANRVDAIICLGVILRGETTHAAHIGEAVSSALMEIQLQHLVPVIHEVLLLENRDQAEARCLDPKHNRGIEAAQAALAMAEVMAEFKASSVKKIKIPN